MQDLAINMAARIAFPRRGERMWPEADFGYKRRDVRFREELSASTLGESEGCDLLGLRQFDR